jgi:hypothetical protein
MPLPRYIPAGAVKVADKTSDALAFLYTNASGKPCARVFYGNQSKPVLACYYATTAQRDRAVTVMFENRRERCARKAAFKREKQEWVPTYQVGDILRTCWGYEQTNVEFFEIVGIKNKFCTIREIAAERFDTSMMQGKASPLPGKYVGEPLNRLMQQHGIKVDDVRTAYPVKAEIVAGVKVYESASFSSYH